MPNDNTNLAETLLRGWTSGDSSAARRTLADNVEFLGPKGQTSGADDYIKGVAGFAKMIAGVEIKTSVSEGDNVVLIYDLITRSGTRIPTAGHYTLRDGKIASVRAYFDPTKLDG